MYFRKEGIGREEEGKKKMKEEAIRQRREKRYSKEREYVVVRTKKGDLVVRRELISLWREVMGYGGIKVRREREEGKKVVCN